MSHSPRGGADASLILRDQRLIFKQTADLLTSWPTSGSTGLTYLLSERS